MIHVQNVAFSYGKSAEILKDISFDLEQGHFLALLGNNGAGKSTLLKCINGILHRSGGVILVGERDVSQMRRNEIARTMAYVEQSNEASQFTVYDAVLMGRKPFIRVNPTKEDIAIAEQAMARMELQDFALRYIDQLSGGELQKVVIAWALAQQPKILLLDEPTSNLDLHNQHEVMHIMQEISQHDGIAVIVVIHDLNLALRYCDRFLLMQDGLVYNYGDNSVITDRSIYDVYHIRAGVTEIGGRKYVLV